MAAWINWEGNGFPLSGLKGGFLEALCPQKCAGELWDWLTQFFDSDRTDVLTAVRMSHISSFFSPVKAKRKSRRQFLWENSTAAFQPYLERYLVAATANSTSGRWMKRNSCHKRSFCVSHWFLSVPVSSSLSWCLCFFLLDTTFLFICFKY